MSGKNLACEMFDQVTCRQTYILSSRLRKNARILNSMFELQHEKTDIVALLLRSTVCLRPGAVDGYGHVGTAS